MEDNYLSSDSNKDQEKRLSDCMVCGGEIIYEQEMLPKICYFCDKELKTNSFCKNGHFVCDTCHARDAVDIIKKVCLVSTEKDMVKLYKKIRNHRSFSIHGPEHHALVAGVVLTAYRNMGRQISKDILNETIDRGASVPGGYCGYYGVCGAAVGVGIAFATILKSTPLTPKERQTVMDVTAEVLKVIAQNEAARCCLRDSVIAINEAVRLSEKYLDIKLVSDEKFICTQFKRNKECIKDSCPFWPGNQ
jgi:hypothetical protein